MPRYRLTVEYDGNGLVGWQRQDNGPSVQGFLENAVARFCGEEVCAVAAGRTDAGVHARAMAVHIDLSKDYPAEKVRDAVNFHLKPARIAIVHACVVSEDFHARFSATARAYEYVYVNRRAPLALELGRAWHIPQAMEADRMNEAAQYFVGHHDFTTFRAAQCQAKSPLKTLSEIDVRRDGAMVRLKVRAPSFLHNQVRSIAGTLMEVGIGKRVPESIAQALQARDRKHCGQVAPAHGLYFDAAFYGDT